jgi:hypothetical protein
MVICASIIHYARRLAAGMAILAIGACGGGTSGERPAAPASVASADSGTAIRPGAQLYGLSKITIDGSTADASGIRASFTTAQNTLLPLVPDSARPGQFWMPVVLERTAGTLSVSAPHRAAIAMPLTLAPFKPSDAPGVATRDFLDASLSNTDAAIRDLLLAGPMPDLLQALTATAELTRQERAWVSNAMRDGSAVMATRKDRTPARMTTDDLKALDQMVLYTAALSANQGALPAAAGRSPWTRIIDILMPSAFAQTSDSAAFTGAAKATGDALGLAANLGSDADGKLVSAFRRGADALATIQMLPNLSFAGPVDKAQAAVGALFAGVIDEIVVPGLDALSEDNALALARNFMASADNDAVENIVLDKVLIFKTGSAGISLCPAGENPFADPGVDFVRCQRP